MLISMLMTGSTDSAIANTLNINVRSVRRWISDLMDELGVSTRLQLGAALVRSDGLRGRARLVGIDRDHAVIPLIEDEHESQAAPKATPAVLNEPRASPRGRNSERNLGEKFHTGCAGQATLTRNSTTGNVRYPGFLAEDLVLACLRQTLSDFRHDFTTL